MRVNNNAINKSQVSIPANRKPTNKLTSKIIDVMSRILLKIVSLFSSFPRKLHGRVKVQTIVPSPDQLPNKKDQIGEKSGSSPVVREPRPKDLYKMTEAEVDAELKRLLGE